MLPQYSVHIIKSISYELKYENGEPYIIVYFYDKNQNIITKDRFLHIPGYKRKLAYSIGDTFVEMVNIDSEGLEDL